MNDVKFYTIAILGVLAIWSASILTLEITKTEIDRGFVTQLSAVCVIVLNQLIIRIGVSKEITTNTAITKEIKEKVS